MTSLEKKSKNNDGATVVLNAEGTDKKRRKAGSNAKFKRNVGTKANSDAECKNNPSALLR